MRYQHFQGLVTTQKKAIHPNMLPPTSARTKYHSLRVFHQVQQWQVNTLPAEDWGWEHSEGRFKPVNSDFDPAPLSLLDIVRCTCKTGCGPLRCGCRRQGMPCSSACSGCRYIWQGYPHTYGYLGHSYRIHWQIDPKSLVKKLGWLDYDDTLRMHYILQFRDTGQVHRVGLRTLYIICITQMSSQMFPNERLTPETLIKSLSLLGYDAWLNCYAHLLFWVVNKRVWGRDTSIHVGWGIIQHYCKYFHMKECPWKPRQLCGFCWFILKLDRVLPIWKCVILMKNGLKSITFIRKIHNVPLQKLSGTFSMLYSRLILGK